SKWLVSHRAKFSTSRRRPSCNGALVEGANQSLYSGSFLIPRAARVERIPTYLPPRKVGHLSVPCSSSWIFRRSAMDRFTSAMSPGVPLVEITPPVEVGVYFTG